MRRIDAHQHYWKIERGDYGWMPTSGPLARDYLPADLGPLNAAAGIAGTILVQAAPTIAETHFMLGLAAEPESQVLGVVGWAPLASPEAPAVLEALAAQPRLVSVRPMLQDLPEVDWIAQPAVIENLQRLARLGLRFDVLSFPQHLPYVLEALDQAPGLPAVIDHLAKPRYRSPEQAEWRHWMRECARRPNVFCKLSGLVTEVGPDWTAEDFRAHAAYALEVFGPERVMFGSDWPVCVLAASHAQVVALAERLLAELSEDEQAQVWGGTAARFYGV